MSHTGTEFKPVSKRDALIFFYKYRRRLLLAFGIPFVLSICAAIYVTPRYEADAVLIVRLGAEYVYNPELSDSRDGSNNIISYNIS